jgi:hypothetical protein
MDQGQAGVKNPSRAYSPHLGRAAKAANLQTRTTFGAVAQLGEHLLCKQGVAGSIPVRSIFYVVVPPPSYQALAGPYRFAPGP